jgi:hypothetical protein
MEKMHIFCLVILIDKKQCLGHLWILLLAHTTLYRIAPTFQMADPISLTKSLLKEQKQLRVSN